MSGVIAHDWISRVGGAEKVLDAMVGAFPTAEVWCLWNDDPVARYPSRTVRESWLARTPLRRTKAASLPLMPAVWRARPVREAEWVLASSHLFAHHIAVRGPAVKKFAYVHTPARYIWCPSLDKRGQGLPRLVAPPLRAIDRRRAQELYRVSANSDFVRIRIQRTWGREADVIYPPVDVKQITDCAAWADRLQADDQDLLSKLPETFILGASRFIPYKRLDLVIKTGEAAQVPVVLAGSGPEENSLRQLAAHSSVPVHFVVHPNDRLLYALYQAALAYVFPAVEDFGIMPVEAMAAGTPVIVPSIGGASETVLHGMTGAHVDADWTGEDLATAVGIAAACVPGECRARAEMFDHDRFTSAIRRWIDSEIGEGG